ncbi:uncharacterized protein LOC110452336 [Mizuhopecten yessoensis]|uniref:uncharacterized protein LOC110452336 n=1 Tax=Mizuhopecten yessoensis TaxID=6573 RepID=UPI000B4577AC|nr:uncharacterized protein LOC110452336 [Mizuhopecten yessoensis]
MASEFFARKLNLELALNPLFHGPHEELMEETPPEKEVKAPKRREHTHSASRIHGGHNTGSQSKFTTGSHINSFEFKNRNPKGVYDFLKVKMDREIARTKTTKIRKFSGKIKKVDETESGNSDKTERVEVIVEVEADTKNTERTSDTSEPNSYQQTVKCVVPKTGSEKTGMVPEILHYSDDFSEGPLEVYEPVFVRFPVWKPAKLNHS